MAFTEVAHRAQILSSQINQIIRALNGTTTYGQPVALTQLNDSGQWALDVRNLDGTNSQALRVRNSGSTVLLQADVNGLQVAVGTSSAPGLKFLGDTDTGIYWVSANKFGLVAGGTEVGRIELDSGQTRGSLFWGGALDSQTIVDCLFDGPEQKIKGRAVSLNDCGNPAQVNFNRYDGPADGYTPTNITLTDGSIVGHSHYGGAIAGVSTPNALPVARSLAWTHNWSSATSSNTPGMIGWEVVGTGTTQALSGYGGGRMFLAAGSQSTGSGFVLINKGASGASLPQPTWTLDVNSNPGSATTAQALRLVNGDDPATGETGHQVILALAVRGTSNAGSTFTDVTAAQIKTSKIADFFNASGNGDDTARLTFETAQAGVMTEALRLENGAATVQNGLTVAAAGANITGGLTVSTGNIGVTLGNITVSAGTLTVSTGLTTLSGGLTVSGTITLSGAIAAADPPAANQLTRDSFAKAWCAFSVSAGTPSVSADYNSTGITDNGVGDYSINFDRAMASVNYAACAMASDGMYMSLADRGTGSVRIRQYDATGTLTDGPGGGVQSVVVFGAQ